MGTNLPATARKTEQADTSEADAVIAIGDDLLALLTTSGTTNGHIVGVWH